MCKSSLIVKFVTFSVNSSTIKVVIKGVCVHNILVSIFAAGSNLKSCDMNLKKIFN
jgi:hypothetical protein